MNKKISGFVLVMVIFALTAVCWAEVSPPQVGGVFPDIELSKPANPAELKYLGLSGSGFFKVNQIKSDVVIKIGRASCRERVCLYV